MDNIDSVIKALEILEHTKNYNLISGITDEQLKEYANLLTELKKYNTISKTNPQKYPNIKNLKGKALEKLVTYLLKISGGIFEVYEDIKTGTNQIDQFVKLNLKGKALKNILPFKTERFIVECKNHQTSVGVDYIGKFCSLMQTTNIRLGLFFTCNGISGGNNWDDARGLIRKFYLSKERLEERFCLVEFNLEDFEKILTGETFLSLLDKKLDELLLDTNYEKLLIKHPIEEKMDINDLKKLETQ